MTNLSEEHPDDRAWRKKIEENQDRKIAELSNALDKMLTADGLAVKYGLEIPVSRDLTREFLQKMEDEILSGNAAHALEMIDFDMKGHYQVPAANWVMRGLANLVLRNWQACIDDSYMAIAANPDFAAAYGLRAEAYLRLGDFVNAVDAAERALACDPDEPRGKAVRAVVRGRPLEGNKLITKYSDTYNGYEDSPSETDLCPSSDSNERERPPTAEEQFNEHSERLFVVLKYSTFLPNNLTQEWVRKIKDIRSEKHSASTSLKILEEIYLEYTHTRVTYKPQRDIWDFAVNKEMRFDKEMNVIKHELDWLQAILKHVEAYWKKKAPQS